MTIYLFLDGLIRDTMHATPSTKTIHDAWNNAHFLEDKEYDSDVGMVEGKKTNSDEMVSEVFLE